MGLKFMGWCFQMQLVLWCTNKHQNNPIFSCLCLWDGAFSHILYFGVQTGTKTNLFLVVYGVLFLLASCTLVYKQAQTYFSCSYCVGACSVVLGALSFFYNRPTENDRAGPEVIKLFPCSTKLSTTFILLINVKIPTISMINTTSERLKLRNFFICHYFSCYEQLKFRAHLS